jgi:ribose transport system permease protein
LIVLENLAFPNGIVYHKESQSIIFSELTHHRVVKFYLSGLRKGSTEVLLDNLIGYGDNLKLNEDGDILIGIPALR